LFEEFVLLRFSFKWLDSSIVNSTEVHLPEEIGTGIIEMLVDQVVDVAVADATMTPRRVMDIDFSVPLLISKYENVSKRIFLFRHFFLFASHIHISLLYINLHYITFHYICLM
jgi:hypothetical protein